MFEFIFLAAELQSRQQEWIAKAKSEAQEELRLRSMPKDEFEREMRIREVRALEQQARKPQYVTIKNHSSIF